MSHLDRLWAGWRSQYVASTTQHQDKDIECVFCGLLRSETSDRDVNVVWRGELTAAILNAYPYGVGHLLILPMRHSGRLDELTPDESGDLWNTINDAARAIESAYGSPGMNIGFNLGESSGAGIPSHLHAHVLPRWNADTNFITAIANAKVLPEALDVTWEKLRRSWPKGMGRVDADGLE